MKKINLRHAAGVAVLAGITALTPAPSQGASDTGNATATIVAAIAISNTADLAFATIVASPSADTVVVNPAGSRTCGGTLFCTGAPAAGSFAVTGGANLTYAITLPGSTLISDGTNTMTVDTFTSTPSATGTLSGAGAQTLTVGATLNVGANQISNAYTGTYTVTVDYN